MCDEDGNREGMGSEVMFVGVMIASLCFDKIEVMVTNF